MKREADSRDDCRPLALKKRIRNNELRMIFLENILGCEK
jgi:hypothetical protein